MMTKVRGGWILFGIFCVAGIVFYSLFFTTPGSRFVTDTIIGEYVAHEGLAYDDLQGDLASGMTFRNLEIKDIKDLPAGTTLRIQELFFNITSLSSAGVHLKVENARLKLPDSDPVVISGTFTEHQLDFNVYSKGLSVNEILGYLPDLKKLIPIRGDAADIDLFITGDYREPFLKGSFLIERFIYEGFLLSDAPLRVDMQLKDVQRDVQLYGTILLDKGTFQTNRVMVSLEEGGLYFSGPWDQPRVHLKGNARIEKTRIYLALTGTVAEPDLNLTSEPPYSREKLMVMLATGKSWQSVEGAGENGLNAAALTKDFVDYFFFSGTSNSFAKRFGVSDFSVTFDENRKGLEATKELSEKLEVGYGIEQQTEARQETTTTQKIQGQYQVTDNVSLGVEKGVTKRQSLDALDPSQETAEDNKVFLEYKKSF